MKFYRLDEIPFQGDEQVFKASPLAKFIPFIIVLSIDIALLVLALRGGYQEHGFHLTPVIVYILAAVFALMGWFTFMSFQASLKPTNWILRCHGSGILINYRTYLNWRFPSGDIHAVGFDYAELAWARTVREKRITVEMNASTRNSGKQTSNLTYLDFSLIKIDTAALNSHLIKERNLAPEGRMVTCDYPVRLTSGGILEIRWNGIHPSVGKAIQCLSQHISIATAETRKIDLTHQQNFSPDEERDKIIELVESGDEIGAVKLARQVYGYTLSEATDFVEKLREE